MVLAHIYGKMERSTTVCGKRMICMVMEFTFIQMVSDMTASTVEIKNKVMASTNGLMAAFMKGGGLAVSNMD